MADTAVAITAGAGTNIDTRTEGTNGNHRQVVVLGDPATNAGVAPVDATNGLTVNPITPTTGGYSNNHLVAAGGGDATSIKASAGQVYSVTVFNAAAAPRYVKFHNTAGAPTPGASVFYTVAVQAGVGAQVVLPHGLAFGTGIAMTIVTGIADNSSTGVTAADVVVDVSYK